MPSTSNIFQKADFSENSSSDGDFSPTDGSDYILDSDELLSSDEDTEKTTIRTNQKFENDSSDYLQQKNDEIYLEVIRSFPYFWSDIKFYILF